MSSVKASVLSRNLLVLAALAALGTARTASAQGAPSTVSFVARLADNGVPLTGAHDFEMSLFASPSGGTALWTEIRNSLSVPADGLLYLDLGNVTALDATVLDGSTRYLEITIDGVTSSPRIPIESVPYAIRAGVCADSERLQSRPASDFQLRVTGACPAGSSISSIDALGGVLCEPDDDTTYTAGTGLALAGTTFNVDTTVIQRRVAGSCAAGSSINAIAEDGTVTCQTDNDTTYTAGPGLLLMGNVFTADTTVVQTRVSGTCGTGEAMQSINGDGTVACGQYIENQSASAQNAAFYINGVARTSATARLGSETGTDEAPSVSGTGNAYTGIVHRRINSSTTTTGTIVARTDNIQLQRDGSNGGFRLVYLKPLSQGAISIDCFGTASNGNTANTSTEISSACGGGGGSCTVGGTPYANGDNVVYFSCMFGTGTGHTTEISMHRTGTGTGAWTGFVTSTLNQ